MQDLIELINLIQRTKFKANGLLEVIVEPETQMGQLYDAIAQKKVRSDDDAKKLFPDTMKDSGRLATIKSKLKDRLNDSVFLLGFKENSYADRHRAFFECTKKWASAMILINKNARLNGISALEKLLRHTEQFEFTELTLDILRVLRLHYGLVVGDEQQYSYYETRLRDVEEIWAAENQVEAFYTELVIRYVNSKADKNAITEKARDYLGKATPLMKRYPSFKVQIFGRLIETIIYDSQNDYRQMTRICEDSIAFFESKPYQTTLSLQVFYYNLVVCYLADKKFDKCYEIIEKFDEFLEDGSFNWFKMQELSFFTRMHAGDYAAAFQIFKKVTEHQHFEHVSAPVAELWKILDAYLCFLMYVGLLKPNNNGTPGEQQIKFRLNRFLNEVPVFSKDKRGMNIPVLIVQFLYLLADGKFDACEERVEALNKYRLRYLYDRETLRSNCFLKLLVSIPGRGFNATQLRPKVAKLRECLAANPWYAVPQSLEIEVVPYEDLLEIVLQCL